MIERSRALFAGERVVMPPMEAFFGGSDVGKSLMPAIASPVGWHSHLGT